MSIINLTPREQQAIGAIDCDSLREVINDCVNEQRCGPARQLGLAECGSYVNTKLAAFERALGTYMLAKSNAKRASTRVDAHRAGDDLLYAVEEMKDRAETEIKEGDFFFIDDQIMSPLSPSRRLAVRISYRWRADPSLDWNHGDITFTHQYAPPPSYEQPQSRRKPSAGQAARDLEDNLYSEWEHLKKLSLCSLRDFFRDGGGGNQIPEMFAVRPAAHGGGLNNFSANFWQAEQATLDAKARRSHGIRKFTSATHAAGVRTDDE